MAAYEYVCPNGHEHVRRFDMGTQPSDLDCDCGQRAKRVFTTPMTSLMGYKAKIGRKCRSNPGDDMYRPHDAAAAAIARTF